MALIAPTFAVILTLFIVQCAEADTLHSAGICSNLLSFYQENALKRVTPYGLNGAGLAFLSRKYDDYPCRYNNCGRGSCLKSRPAALSISPNAPATIAARAPQAGVDFSTTNVQIEGVDEPDIIKTDGKHVFVVRRKIFYVVRVDADGARGTVTSRVELPTYASEILFEGNNILVIASEYGSLVPKPQQRPKPFAVKSSARLSIPYYSGSPITTVYKIRVWSWRAYLAGTLRMEGRYVSSREVSGVARVVIATNRMNSLRFPRECDTAAQAIARHKRTIRATSIEDWLPRYTLTGWTCGWHCRTQPTPLTGCSSVYLPSGDFTGFGLLTVVTIPLTTALFHTRHSVSIASEGREVYATAKSLYVTATKYRYDVAEGLAFSPRFTTSFHKFSLHSDGAVYRASGAVSGSVLNQFAMHEHEGKFFVATTDGAWWWGGRDLSKSKVSAYAVSGRKLNKVGEVGNLGVGERIYSVRYIGDICYVVTFRQVDPLYIIDLRDPTKLRKTGELKIPGFSSYLHPVSPGLILGVGQEATAQGRTTGAKVSLFDVSNVYRPLEVAIWSLKGSYTNAQWDHRAFLFWKPKNLLVLPVNVYSNNVRERFSGSIVLKIANKKISEVGRIRHPTTGKQWQQAIERNLVLGRINLWSLSSNTLQVNNIDTLTKTSVLPLN